MLRMSRRACWQVGETSWIFPPPQIILTSKYLVVLHKGNSSKSVTEAQIDIGDTIQHLKLPEF